jgi:hypothetical protein
MNDTLSSQDGSNNSATQDTKSLLDLHIAEYNALTARNTQWSVIQSNIWVLFIIALTLIATFWASHPDYPRSAISTAGLIAEGVLIGLCFATMEIYRNVYYLEHELRRSVERLLQRKGVWQYEQFLFKRSGRKPWWSDAAGAGLGFGVLVSVIFTLFRYTHGWIGVTIGIVVNCGGFAVLVFQTCNLVKQRKKFEEATELTLTLPPTDPNSRK